MGVRARRLGRLAVADAPRQLEAVHGRHLQIGQHEVVATLAATARALPRRRPPNRSMAPASSSWRARILRLTELSSTTSTRPFSRVGLRDASGAAGAATAARPAARATARTSTSRRHGRGRPEADALRHSGSVVQGNPPAIPAGPRPRCRRTRPARPRHGPRRRRPRDNGRWRAPPRRSGSDEAERQAFQRRLGRRLGGGPGRGQPHGDDEGRADAGFALDLDVALHGLGQTAHDGEAETGAAEAARGRAVGLHEGLEQALALFGGEADAAVGDADAQPDIVAAVIGQALQREPDRARFGELDGVAQQVEQDLLQAQRIADHPVGHVGGDIGRELEALGGGLRRQRLGRALDQLDGREFERSRDRGGRPRSSRSRGCRR